MAREITQFSSVDYNLASDEDIEKNQAAKFEAMRLFEAEAEKGELDKLGGVENVRRVRLMEDAGAKKLVYDLKRPAKEALQEKRAKALAELFFSVAPNLASAILLRAAQLFEERVGGRDLTPEDKELATRCVEETQAAFKLAQEEAARRLAKAAANPGKKPSQKRQNGPRNGGKHQGRGKSGPIVQRVQRPAQAR